MRFGKNDKVILSSIDNKDDVLAFTNFLYEERIRHAEERDICQDWMNHFGKDKSRYGRTSVVF